MSARIRVSAPEARTLDGILFASKAEMQRYWELRVLEKKGLITDLECQPEYVLQEAYLYKGKKVQPIKYRADFRYRDTLRNRIIVEDCKGMATEVYKLKKKLLLKRYPDMNFVEVKA